MVLSILWHQGLTIRLLPATAANLPRKSSGQETPAKSVLPSRPPIAPQGASKGPVSLVTDRSSHTIARKPVTIHPKILPVPSTAHQTTQTGSSQFQQPMSTNNKRGVESAPPSTSSNASSAVSTTGGVPGQVAGSLSGSPNISQKTAISVPHTISVGNISRVPQSSQTIVPADHSKLPQVAGNQELTTPSTTNFQKPIKASNQPDLQQYIQSHSLFSSQPNSQQFSQEPTQLYTQPHAQASNPPFQPTSSMQYSEIPHLASSSHTQSQSPQQGAVNDLTTPLPPAVISQNPRRFINMSQSTFARSASAQSSQISSTPVPIPHLTQEEIC